MAIKVTKNQRYVFVFLTLITTSVLADNTFLPLTPGVSLTGYAGNGWTAIGDTLIPAFGQQSYFTYLNPQINYHSNQDEYTGSLGVGERWLQASNIWGAYVFGDYNHSAQNNGFWFVSPGVERLGRVLDFSANGYIPVSKQRIDTGTAFADTTGDFNQVQFSGHNQYDELVNTFESTGWGADAQIGIHLASLHQTKLSVGSYYFNPQDSHSILGGAIRVETPITAYLSLNASEAYDGQTHNTLKIGLSLTLVGRHSGAGSTGDLSQRLVDPVQRQLIAVSGGSHTGAPIVSGTENTGQVALEATNISFFVADPTDENTGNGTYENPYHGFNQDAVNDANQQNNRSFYLNSGNYNTQEITLNNDQLYGRQNNFQQPAQGDQRPLLNFSGNGLIIGNNDSADSLNDLQLSGSGNGDGNGVLVNHTDETDLHLAITDTAINHFLYGVQISSHSNAATTVTINNAEITDNSNQGILAQNQGSGGLNLSVTGADIERNGASGIYLVDYQTGNLTANITHSQINQNANNGIYAINEFNSGTLTLNVSHAQIEDNASSGIQLNNGASFNVNTGSVIGHISDSTITGNSNGIIATNTASGPFTLTVDHSAITDNSNNGIVALNTGGTGPFTLQASYSTVSSNGINGFEIFNEADTGNFSLSIQQSTASNNSSHGIFLDNSVSNGNFSAEISHSTINNNGMDGIYALNDLSAGSMSLSITHSTVDGNFANGVFLDNRGKGSSLNANISTSNISGNGLNGVSAANETTTGSLLLTMTDSTILNNQFNGIVLNQKSITDGGLTATITDSTIADNQRDGLTANNGATATLANAVFYDNGISVAHGGVINIENPVYFDSALNNKGGIIQFNGVDAPAGATHVSCVLNECTFGFL
jgi:Inverse autotransporter, beta-domain